MQKWCASRTLLQWYMSMLAKRTRKSGEQHLTGRFWMRKNPSLYFSKHISRKFLSLMVDDVQTQQYQLQLLFEGIENKVKQNRIKSSRIWTENGYEYKQYNLHSSHYKQLHFRRYSMKADHTEAFHSHLRWHRKRLYLNINMYQSAQLSSLQWALSTVVICTAFRDHCFSSSQPTLSLSLFLYCSTK